VDWAGAGSSLALGDRNARPFRTRNRKVLPSSPQPPALAHAVQLPQCPLLVAVPRVLKNQGNSRRAPKAPPVRKAIITVVAGLVLILAARV